MNIYRFPPVSSELVASGSVAGSDDIASSLSSGLFRGLPSNEPVHVLVRIYVVKVRLYVVFLHSSDYYTAHKCHTRSSATAEIARV